MMRIYPFAFRVTSSNLDPSFYWRRGAQLVALNWQNLDKGMMLNHGMFVGTPGWELKPPGYRSGEPAGLIRRQTLNLTIEVFAAQNLSLPHSDRSERWFHPYVNCQLHVEEPEDSAATGDDASSESEKSSYRRCTKSSTGCNPDFEGQKLGFPTVAGIVEELSFVRLVAFFLDLFSFSCCGFLHPRCCRGSCLQLVVPQRSCGERSSLHRPAVNAAMRHIAFSQRDCLFGLTLQDRSTSPQSLTPFFNYSMPS